MTRRISLRFILYFLGFYLALVCLTVSLLIYYLAEPITSFDIYSTIKEIAEEDIDNNIEQDSEGHYFFSDKLIAFSKKNSGMLQLLDKNGHVIGSTSNTDNLPDYYSFSDLIDMLQHDKYYSWLIEDDMTVLFIEHTDSDLLLKQLVQNESFPDLSQEDITHIHNANAVFDLYDTNGKLVYTTDEQKKLNVPEILHTSLSLFDSKEIKSFHTLDDRSVAVVRMPNLHYKPIETAGYNIFISILKALGIFHLLLLIIVIIFSLLIGRRFGRPILYFLRRIERLSKNDYSDVNDEKFRNKKTGKLKTKYKLYHDVDDSLTALTQNLVHNEQKIKQTEQLREDWITGLSHDLKTPLSTILGYSTMLGSAHEWTNEERRKFAQIIEEKSNYMDELINDLTYTYQLKNNGIVLDLVHTELNQYMKGFFKKNTLQNLHFDPAPSPIYIHIDVSRFQRVIDNLIINAITHNSDDTNIHVKVLSTTANAIIEINDDGQGMSEETLANLFNRYYRGTNTTTEDIGTGLGLTIAKQLVEAHGGTITVTSNKSGTNIQIKLPFNSNRIITSR